MGPHILIQLEGLWTNSSAQSLVYILFIFNSNLLSDENNEKLKVGLLAPLSGSYNQIGNSLLYSLHLALEEINDENVIIVPRDSGFNNEKKLDTAILWTFWVF